MKQTNLDHTTWFYQTLKTILVDGDVCDCHVLKRLPADPLSRGQLKSEMRAVKELEQLCGKWSPKLRQLYYGYSQSGRRRENLDMGISYLTMYNDELRELLRSHEGDEQVFPSVFIPDEKGEAEFRAKLREIDRRCTEESMSDHQGKP